MLYDYCKVLLLCLIKFFFNIESLKLDKQFLSIVFSEYRHYYLLFFDITLNFLEKNIYANLLTRWDDACVITPYLFIYLFYDSTLFREKDPKLLSFSRMLVQRIVVFPGRRP